MTGSKRIHFRSYTSFWRNAGFLGTVGLDWQAMGFGNFSSLGENDMILRNLNTGGVE